MAISVCFGAPALHLHGTYKLEEETSEIFTLYLTNCEEWDPSKFQGGHKNDIPKVEDVLQLYIFLNDISIFDKDLIAKFSCTKIPIYDESVKVLPYTDQTCYASNIKAFFNSFRGSASDTFFSKATFFKTI